MLHGVALQGRKPVWNLFRLEAPGFRPCRGRSVSEGRRFGAQGIDKSPNSVLSVCQSHGALTQPRSVGLPFETSRGLRERPVTFVGGVSIDVPDKSRASGESLAETRSHDALRALPGIQGSEASPFAG